MPKVASRRVTPILAGLSTAAKNLVFCYFGLAGRAGLAGQAGPASVWDYWLAWLAWSAKLGSQIRKKSKMSKCQKWIVVLHCALSLTLRPMLSPHPRLGAAVWTKRPFFVMCPMKDTYSHNSKIKSKARPSPNECTPLHLSLLATWL